MNMRTEPIRLPAIAWALLTVIVAAAIAWALDLELEEVIVIIGGAIVTTGGAVALAESRRARTDSPATVERRLAGLAGEPLPEDERGHDHGV